MTDFETTVRSLARKYALENAVKHGGKANPGAVVGKVMAEGAEMRPRAKEVGALVAAVVGEVNATPLADLQAEFERDHAASFAARATEKAEAAADRPRLKPLQNATKGKVVLRLAPNPSGPPHFGHGRGMVITDEYKRMYDGTFILRFDDTDTTVKPPWPPAYAMFQETVEWLTGRKADRVIYASDHMEHYVDWALELIRRGGGYVCECEADVFRALKERGEPCPHRETSADENEAKFKRMVDGGYRRGAAVLRVKTDIAHKDPAMRDWVAFRIAEEPHPRLAEKGMAQYSAWPLLDFQSAIDDHLQGVTHIIRGKDLRDSTAKQEFLYAHLGWTYPETTYWGRVSVHEFGKFSKSILNKAIEAGEYTGWDDPRLPTFPALRRRGFTPEGIRSFWLDFGISEKDIAASILTLEAANKKVIEPIAPHLFFVPEPLPISVPPGVFPRRIQLPLFPGEPNRGMRILEVNPDEGIVIPAVDAFEVFRAKRRDAGFRLKELENIEIDLDEHQFDQLRALRNAFAHGTVPKELAAKITEVGKKIAWLESNKGGSPEVPEDLLFSQRIMEITDALEQPPLPGIRYDPRASQWVPPKEFWRLAFAAALLKAKRSAPNAGSTRPIARSRGTDLNWVKAQRAPVVQWAPAEGISAALVRPDATVVTGIVEPAASTLPVGSIVQFERIGFARLDSRNSDGNLVFYFAHQ